MRYARGRRLSEAARALTAGAPDILAVALSAGYGSHEAFTRAFHEQFGVTPETCRAAGSLDHIELVGPIRMDKSLLIDLDEPRFEDHKELLIAGFGARYTFETNEGIPGQWLRFGPHIGSVPRQVGPETYGVACNFDVTGSSEYIAGVQVSAFGALSEAFATVRIKAQHYAVFSHHEHVDAATHALHDLEQMVTGFGYGNGGRAKFRALQQRIQSNDWHRPDRGLDAGKRSHEGVMIWVGEAWTMNFEVT